MTNRQMWFLRASVLIPCAGLVISFILPWWTGRFYSGEGQAILNIYGWGIPDQQSYLSTFIASDITPQHQVILAWAFCGTCSLVAICGAWTKRKLGALMQGTAGMAVMSYAFVAYFVVITNRLGESGISPRGLSAINLGYFVDYSVKADLRFGFYLACISGGLLILLSIIRLAIKMAKGN